jgi:UDP-2,3-diacylglucosamine hydrolase
LPTYFASDMHLRDDRPDRGQRLARWVETLRPDDDLYLLGDVGDFWFATRQAARPGLADPGLRALADFRHRGGRLTILPGNHDAQLGPFYRERLGALLIDDDHRDLLLHGLRVRILHGHRLGARSAFKAAMEGEGFYRAFRALPGPVAHALATSLELSNARNEPAIIRRHLARYRAHAAALAGTVDLVFFGHVHGVLDRADASPRWIVLGDWKHAGSYVRIDEQGAEHVVFPGATPLVEPA